MSIFEENPGAEGDRVLRRRRRRRWSEAQKRQIMAETHEPGVSVPMVAQRYNLNPNQVFRWRRLFCEAKRAGGAGRFVPVVVEGTRAAAAETKASDAEAHVAALFKLSIRLDLLGCANTQGRFTKAYARILFNYATR